MRNKAGDSVQDLGAKDPEIDLPAATPSRARGLREEGASTRRLATIDGRAPCFYPADILTAATLLWYSAGIMTKHRRTSTADVEYSLGRPTSKVPPPNRPGPKTAVSKHEKLYQLLLSLEDEKWIPVKCSDWESARAMANVARMYFYKRDRKLEIRYEDTEEYNTVFMRLAK